VAGRKDGAIHELDIRMWVGVLVIAILFAIALHWLADEEKRRRLQCGFSG
jgi:hypothetical protein